MRSTKRRWVAARIKRVTVYTGIMVEDKQRIADGMNQVPDLVEFYKFRKRIYYAHEARERKPLEVWIDGHSPDMWYVYTPPGDDL